MHYFPTRNQFIFSLWLIFTFFLRVYGSFHSVAVSLLHSELVKLRSVTSVRSNQSNTKFLNGYFITIIIKGRFFNLTIL